MPRKSEKPKTNHCVSCNKMKTDVSHRNPADEFKDCDDLGSNTAEDYCDKCFNKCVGELRKAYDEWLERKKPKTIAPPKPTKEQYGFNTLLNLCPFELRSENAYWLSRLSDTEDRLSDIGKLHKQLEKIRHSIVKKSAEIEARITLVKTPVERLKAVQEMKAQYEFQVNKRTSLVSEADDKIDNIEAECRKKQDDLEDELERRISALREDYKTRKEKEAQAAQKRIDTVKERLERDLADTEIKIERTKKQYDGSLSHLNPVVDVEANPAIVGLRTDEKAVQDKLDKLTADPAKKLEAIKLQVNCLTFKSEDNPTYTKVLKVLLNCVSKGILACESIEDLRSVVSDWDDHYEYDQIGNLIMEICNATTPIKLVGSEAQLEAAFEL